ncbi:hypothetical protein [Geobacillus stearothermophilus]|nr:hypothetical protein [Geobacillus stearothermophilus]
MIEHEVSDIKTNMATKQELEEVKQNFTTELEDIKANMATKRELEEVRNRFTKEHSR